MNKDEQLTPIQKMVKSKPNSIEYFKYFKEYCIENGWFESSANGYSILDDNFEMKAYEESKEGVRFLCTK